MSDKKKIILVQPKATFHGGFRAPLNLLQIATPLIQNGFDVKVLDLHVENPSNHELREHLEDSLFIGISAFTGLQSSEAIRFAKIVRCINSQIPIVWGGYHPSLWHELATSSSLVDYVIVGPGEQSVLELSNLMHENCLPESKVLLRENNLEIPSPSWHLIDLKKYLAKTLLADRVGNINTSYGCPHQCSFCAVSRVFDRKWQAKPSSQVIDEVDFLLKKYEITGLELSDNAPFINKQRMLDMADGFIKKGFNFVWMSMARADELNALSPDEWKLLVRSGFKRVFVGIESGDDNVLHRIMKNEKVEQYIQFAENCSRFGVIPDYSITIGYLPDPMKDMESSFELIRKLKKITPSGTVMFYRYTPYAPDDSLRGIMKFPSRWEDWAEKPWNSYSLTSASHPWLKNSHIKRLRDFETVMTCAFYHDENIFPQTGSMKQLLAFLIPIARFRWERKCYSSPLELKILRRLFLSFNRASRKSRMGT